MLKWHVTPLYIIYNLLVIVQMGLTFLTACFDVIEHTYIVKVSFCLSKYM